MKPFLQKAFCHSKYQSMLLLVMLVCVGHEPRFVSASEEHPLEPLDTSSPRSTLVSFLKSGDAFLELVVNYWDEPSYDGYIELRTRVLSSTRALDLSEIAPSAREKASLDAVTELYEVLSKIELPPEEDIPDFSEQADGASLVDHWTIPHTAITIARIEDGPRAGEYLFTAATVARVGEYFEKTKDLPYYREVPFEDYGKKRRYLAGWWIAPETIENLPEWPKYRILKQAIWKWISLAALLLIGLLAFFLVFRLTSTPSNHPIGKYFRGISLPIFLLVLMPLLCYIALIQIRFSGEVALAISITTSIFSYLSWAWLASIIPMILAELVITSPRIADQSIDAHLLRLGGRVVGIGLIVLFLVYGAEQIGLPVVGVLASLGVGGLAVALAAQNSIENFLGSMNIYFDRPVKVGDFCFYGDRMGTIESIGLRSTRIRGLDRTIATIPNSQFSKMEIINLAKRDRILLKTVLGLRYETSEKQLRYVLAKLRELLLQHSQIDDDPARVRFVGYGDFSLQVEIFAYALTSDYNEFLAIQEDVLFQAGQVIKDAGTGFAFPSQTIYQSQDEGINNDLQKQIEKEVDMWKSVNGEIV